MFILLVCVQADQVEYSDLDLKAMLHSLGLVGKLPCETLIKLHRDLNSCTDLRGEYFFSNVHCSELHQLVLTCIQ